MPPKNSGGVRPNFLSKSSPGQVPGFLFWDAGTGETRRLPAPDDDARCYAYIPLTAKAVESKLGAVDEGGLGGG